MRTVDLKAMNMINVRYEFIICLSDKKNRVLIIIFLQNGHKEESDHIKIVLIVFGVIITVLAIAFLVNCTRKIIRDHKIIRVSGRRFKK